MVGVSLKGSSAVVVGSIHTARYTATPNSAPEVDDTKVGIPTPYPIALIPKPHRPAMERIVTWNDAAGDPRSTGRYVYYRP
jgi:hypothetical protein